MRLAPGALRNLAARSTHPGDCSPTGIARILGIVDLRNAILARPEVFVRTMTEKLLTYALGRGVDFGDMPTVRGIVRGAAAKDDRFSALVLGIVTSTPFQMENDHASGIR